MLIALDTYLRAERGRAGKIAAAVHVNVQFVWQIARGERPCPYKLATKIEVACDRQVTRRDLCPDDWQEIWPELVTGGEAEAEPVTQPGAL